MRNVTGRNTSRVALLAVATLLGACGGDDDSAGDGTSDEASRASDANGEAGVDAGGLDGSPIEPVAGTDICSRLATDDVGTALGLEVTAAQPYDTSTPQCAYTYDSASGAASNVTVASMRTDGDLGGRTGDEAFDYVVEVNRGVAGGTDFTEDDLDVGDRAVRFTGDALHLGILATGGHLLTVIVPTGDTDPAAVDQLIGTMADTFAG